MRTYFYICQVHVCNTVCTSYATMHACTVSVASACIFAQEPCARGDFLLEAGHNAAHGSGVRIGASSPGFRSQIPNVDLLGSDGGVPCERGCCTGSSSSDCDQCLGLFRKRLPMRHRLSHDVQP